MRPRSGWAWARQERLTSHASLLMRLMPRVPSGPSGECRLEWHSPEGLLAVRADVLMVAMQLFDPPFLVRETVKGTRKQYF